MPVSRSGRNVIAANRGALLPTQREEGITYKSTPIT